MSKLNATSELKANLDPGDNRPQSVGRAGTPLTMGPTTTTFFTEALDDGNQNEKEDAVGMAQYTSAVE